MASSNHLGASGGLEITSGVAGDAGVEDIGSGSQRVRECFLRGTLEDKEESDERLFAEDLVIVSEPSSLGGVGIEDTDGLETSGADRAGGGGGDVGRTFGLTGNAGGAVRGSLNDVTGGEAGGVAQGERGGVRPREGG